MKPNPTDEPAFGILKTGTTISDSASWLDSLLTQIRELRRERKHPRPQVEITAERDPSALDKLVEMPSPVMSLFGDLREAIRDYRHPRKIESSVAPVAVEEVWSNRDDGLPKPLSVFVHVLVVTAPLVRHRRERVFAEVSGAARAEAFGKAKDLALDLARAAA